jgi:hypothetical protein
MKAISGYAVNLSEYMDSAGEDFENWGFRIGGTGHKTLILYDKSTHGLIPIFNRMEIESYCLIDGCYECNISTSQHTFSLALTSRIPMFKGDLQSSDIDVTYNSALGSSFHHGVAGVLSGMNEGMRVEYAGSESETFFRIVDLIDNGFLPANNEYIITGDIGDDKQYLIYNDNSIRNLRFEKVLNYSNNSIINCGFGGIVHNGVEGYAKPMIYDDVFEYYNIEGVFNTQFYELSSDIRVPKSMRNYGLDGCYGCRYFYHKYGPERIKELFELGFVVPIRTKLEDFDEGPPPFIFGLRKVRVGDYNGGAIIYSTPSFYYVSDATLVSQLNEKNVRMILDSGVVNWPIFDDGLEPDVKVSGFSLSNVKNYSAYKNYLANSKVINITTLVSAEYARLMYEFESPIDNYRIIFNSSDDNYNLVSTVFGAEVREYSDFTVFNDEFAMLGNSMTLRRFMLQFTGDYRQVWIDIADRRLDVYAVLITNFKELNKRGLNVLPYVQSVYMSEAIDGRSISTMIRMKFGGNSDDLYYERFNYLDSVYNIKAHKITGHYRIMITDGGSLFPSDEYDMPMMIDLSGHAINYILQSMISHRGWSNWIGSVFYNVVRSSGLPASTYEEDTYDVNYDAGFKESGINTMWHTFNEYVLSIEIGIYLGSKLGFRDIKTQWLTDNFLRFMTLNESRRFNSYNSKRTPVKDLVYVPRDWYKLIRENCNNEELTTAYKESHT